MTSAAAPHPPASSQRKGRLGEVRIRSLLQRAGWRAGLQPGSGSMASRSDAPLRSGDLWAVCGEARLRVEVKHHKREPRALQTMRGGCEVLAYLCSDTGRMAVFIDEGLFVDLLAWSAETLAGEEGGIAGHKPPARFSKRPGPGAAVDGEIARARLEALLAEGDYALLIQLERLSRTLQVRADRARLLQASRLPQPPQRSRP